MDWRRAKTILITAFLLLNFFLASKVFDTIGKQNQYLNNNKITDEQIRNLLKLHQIQLGPNVKKIDTEQVNIRKGSLEKITNSQPIGPNRYEKSVDFPENEDYNANTVENIVRKHYPGKIRFAYQEADSFYFYQVIDGYSIYTKEPIVATLKNGKLHMKAIYFKPDPSDYGELIQITPVNNALNTLIIREDLKNTTVEQIELGYHLSSSDPAYLLPVWRFQIGGKPYIIHAHQSESTVNIVKQN